MRAGFNTNVFIVPSYTDESQSNQIWLRCDCDTGVGGELRHQAGARICTSFYRPIKKKCSDKMRLQSSSTKSLPGDVGLSETNGYTSIDRRLPHYSEVNNGDQSRTYRICT